MSKLTCRECGQEEHQGECGRQKEQTEKLKLIGKDEMLCVSLPFGWCFDEVKDLIEASCIFQLEADQLVVNKLEAERDAAISQVGKLARELGQQDARIKDLESINESHQKLNGELRERIKELEETTITKDDIRLIKTALENESMRRYGNVKKDAPIFIRLAKLQKIIDKRG